jgi:SET domain-containing protein
MTEHFIHPHLSIAETVQKGRGVFATEPIEENTVIEIAPVIVFDAEQRAHLEKTELYNYIFEWGDDYTGCCVALGWASIYNHAGPSNCEYVMNFDESLMIFITRKNIEAGEELTVNYSTEWHDQKPVWFEAV